MAPTVSTRNLAADSVLSISDPVTTQSSKKKPLDPWKVVAGVCALLLLVATGVIVYLVLQQMNAVCKMKTEVKIPGADAKYTLVKLDKTFDDARAYCNSTGGDLASFSSMSDWRSFAGKLFFMASVDGWAKPMWLGARGDGNDAFRWTDGTPFVFNTTQRSGAAPWYYQVDNIQPNNGFAKGICVYTYVGNGRTPDHSWLDYDCPTAMWFVCEK